MSKVFLHKSDRSYNLYKTGLIKLLIENLFKQENVPLQRVDYIFCSDDFLLNINQKHLSHNTLTDIITFPLSNNELVRGEIYISVDRIKENAKTFQVHYQSELLRVMIHGALHLCGYKDKKKLQQVEMRNKEDYYLKKYNVPREASPY